MPSTFARHGRGLIASARAGSLRRASLRGLVGIFDEKWYRHNYPEIGQLSGPPLLHYLTEGASRGFDPSPLFDTDWYLQTYPAVATSGINPLVHYVTTPAVRDFDPSPAFSSRWYLDRYPDVAAAGVNPLLHYIRRGRDEGRHPTLLSLCSDEMTVETSSSAVAEPRVTIVIPIYGQWLYTERCLRALAVTEASTLARILVVDDRSPDDSLGQLGRYPDVRVLPLAANVGYTRAVNLAVAQVETPFVLLLNNDVEPQPGFLTAMLEQLDRDATIGSVGSRLVYPDGLLQEAGSIIWHDASGFNYGRNRRADSHVALYPRDVDYCSAASLLVRTSLWRQCGGFDEQYAPAYYEDTDLAFEIRRQGYRVRYEPRSLVIHHEGRSHGTDTSAGLKRHQVLNQQKFRTKWAIDLGDQPMPEDFPLSVAADRDRRRIMVLVREALITPLRDAGSLRMLQIFQSWQRLGFRVVHITPHADPHLEEAVALRSAGVEVITTEDEAREFLDDNQEWIAAIWYSHVGAVLRWLPVFSDPTPDVPTVFDTVDLHHLREERLAALTGGELAKLRARKTREQERWAIRKTDATVVVSSTEAQYLQKQSPDAQVHLVSIIHAPQECVRSFQERRGLLFIGSFHHPPNADAIDWFFDEVWPRLSDEVRMDGVDVVGSPTPQRLVTRELPGVRVHGWVPETRPFLDSARVALAPLRYGGGVKGKVGEAWSHGLPVAGTSVALDGMIAPGQYPIGDTAEAFADVVNLLYTDHDVWTTTREAGLAQVGSLFSPEAAERALAALQADLDRGRGIPRLGAESLSRHIAPWDLPGWPYQRPAEPRG